MKKIIYVLIALTVLSSVVAFENYDNFQLSLESDSNGDPYDNFVLNFQKNATDTCTCPGLNNNWQVDMTDNCVINAACDLGTGSLTFIGASGNFTCNANIITNDLGGPPNNTIIFVNSNCDLEIK